MYCLHITSLKCEGLSWRARKGNFFCVIFFVCCWTFFFKVGVFSPILIFFLISCLLYEKNLYTSVYIAKGKNTYPLNSVWTCDIDKALEPPSAVVRGLWQSHSNRLQPPAHPWLLIPTPAPRGFMISVLLIVVISFWNQVRDCQIGAGVNMYRW